MNKPNNTTKNYLDIPFIPTFGSLKVSVLVGIEKKITWKSK